jgi:conjugal transfer pilus assembly protein TraV
MRATIVLPISTLAATLFLSGCTSVFNAGGSTEYACPGMPNGATCKKPSEIYAETKNRSAAIGSDMKPATQSTIRAPMPSAIEQPTSIAPTLGSLPHAMQPGASRGVATIVPRPILEPAVVLRIWFAPYISDKGDLKYPSYVYSEITARRWSFGESAAKDTAIISPLQVEQREAGNFVSSPSGDDESAAPRAPPSVRNISPTQSPNNPPSPNR